MFYFNMALFIFFEGIMSPSLLIGDFYKQSLQKSTNYGVCKGAQLLCWWVWEVKSPKLESRVILI